MLLVRFLSLLPFGMLYFMSEVVAFMVYHVFRYRRGVVRENLLNAFPDKSNKEITRIEKKFYRHFSQIFAEFVKGYRFAKRDWQERVMMSNPELLTEFLDKGIPVVLMAGHTANWEWPAFSIGQQIDYPFEFMYKPVKNQGFDKVMMALRTRHGGTAIAKDSAMREIIKRRKVPRIIGVIGDQLPAMGTEKLWFNFLNQETAFYTGAERIAVSTGYAAFYIHTKRISKGRYELTFEKITEPPYQKDDPRIIEGFVKRLEQSIRSKPSDYLWTHKRWKYTKAEEEEFLSQL